MACLDDLVHVPRASCFLDRDALTDNGKQGEPRPASEKRGVRVQRRCGMEIMLQGKARHTNNAIAVHTLHGLRRVVTRRGRLA